MAVTMAMVGERLRSQDNRCTMHPMFCVQILVRDVGYDPEYSEHTVWVDMESGEYEEVPARTEGAEEFGYKERWETVMVALTERGCEEFLELDGHNVRRRARNGEVRIYVESFRRCPEMIAVREALMGGLGEGTVADGVDVCVFCPRCKLRTVVGGEDLPGKVTCGHCGNVVSASKQVHGDNQEAEL